MIERKTVSGTIFDSVNVVVLGFIALICLYPVWHVVMGSFSAPQQLGVHSGLLLWPQGFSLLGYEIVFKNRFIWIGYLNTIWLIVSGTAARMFMTALGAYVLSRKDFILRMALLRMVIVTMYFGGGMIPSYLLIRNLGLYNTYAALILPSLIATWNMFVLRSAFQRVPDSLDESARIDGANDLTILLKIIFPVTKATLAVIALYYVVSAWNSWFTATIYLQERGKYPLQVILREILISRSANQTGEALVDNGEIDNMYLEELVRYATIVVATLPILCAYPFVQKYFVAGVMMGSLKE